MTVEQMLLQKYQVIADYPGSNYNVGEIVTAYHSDEYKNYPSVFKHLKWYKGIPIEEMAKIKYAKVVEYVGYWRVGDIVEVIDYVIEKKPFLHISELVLKGKYKHSVDKIIPATEEDYIKFRKEIEDALSGKKST